MVAKTINFAPLSDADPYSFPAGWAVIKDSFKIQSGSLRSKYTNTGQSIVITTDPATSGLLDVTFAVLQSSAAGGGDSSGAVFCSPSGNGYAVDIRGTSIFIKPVTAGAISSSNIGTVAAAYLSGDTFRATYNLSTNEINVYQHSVSTTIPVLTASSLTPQTGMAGGLEVMWENNNSAGIISTSIDGFAPTSTIDTITTGGVSGLKVGSGFAITTTGLGNLTEVTIETLGLTGTKVIAQSLSAFAGDGNAIQPPWVVGEKYPLPGTVTVVAKDGTLNATTTTTLSIPDTYLDVEFDNVITSDDTYLGKKLNDLGEPLADGDLAYWPITDDGLTINANSGVSVENAMTTIVYIHKLDGTIEGYNLTITEAGVITGAGKITSRGITSRGISTRRITSRL